MKNLTSECNCHSGCKDLKIHGQNEFWIKFDPFYGDHNPFANCNCCGSRFYLDGKQELTGGPWGIGWGPDPSEPKEGCHYCAQDDEAMSELEAWRKANKEPILELD